MQQTETTLKRELERQIYCFPVMAEPKPDDKEECVGASW
jgi:hypothetical protein